MRHRFLGKIICNYPLLPLAFLTLSYLTFYRFLIVWVPLKYWKRYYGIPFSETLQTSLAALHYRRARKLQHVVQVVSEYVPWKSQCLDRALTYSTLLKREGFSSTVYIGMNKKTPQKWDAHAWVRTGTHWGIGYQPQTHYTVVGWYAWPA